MTVLCKVRDIVVIFSVAKTWFECLVACDVVLCKWTVSHKSAIKNAFYATGMVEIDRHDESNTKRFPS